MSRTRIKICGICRPEDAAIASDAGADAIGMIFHPSARRNITIDTARTIVQSIGPFVTPVGVFVNAETATILQVAQTLSLRLIQLHGDESPGDAEALAANGLRILKAVRVDATFLEQIEQWRRFAKERSGVLAGIVLDTPDSVGGSGVLNDFNAVVRHAASKALDDLPTLIAAGGLTPEKVRGVIESLRPWGVDVSSGVEESVGIKSADKVRAFIAAVRDHR